MDPLMVARMLELASAAFQTAFYFAQKAGKTEEEIGAMFNQELIRFDQNTNEALAPVPERG